MGALQAGLDAPDVVAAAVAVDVLDAAVPSVGSGVGAAWLASSLPHHGRRRRRGGVDEAGAALGSAARGAMHAGLGENKSCCTVPHVVYNTIHHDIYTFSWQRLRKWVIADYLPRYVSGR